MGLSKRRNTKDCSRQTTDVEWNFIIFANSAVILDQSKSSIKSLNIYCSISIETDFRRPSKCGNTYDLKFLCNFTCKNSKHNPA
jgi:hypothetical protein